MGPEPVQLQALFLRSSSRSSNLHSIRNALPSPVQVAWKTMRLLSVLSRGNLYHLQSVWPDWGGWKNVVSLSPQLMQFRIYFLQGDDNYSGERFERTLIINLQISRMGINRRVVFSTDQLIMSFGGAIGLFLGASFMTIYGVVYFFLTFIAYTCRNRFCKRFFFK